MKRPSPDLDYLPNWVIFVKRELIYMALILNVVTVKGWFSLAHKHKHKHRHNIIISKWEHPRHKHKLNQKNEPTYLSYAVLTRA